MEQKNLNRIKKLLYLLATRGTGTPNVSQLAQEVLTSRTTIANYIKFLSDARLINILYRKGEDYPKKPGRIMMNNTNLMYAMTPGNVNTEDLMDTFFQNAIWGKHKIRIGDRGCTFLLDNQYRFRLQNEAPKRKSTDVIYVRSDKNIGDEQVIPLWMFGLLY